MKYHSVLLNETGVSTLGGFLQHYLNSVAEGISEAQRDGNQIFGKGFSIKLNLNNNTNSSAVYVRMALVSYPEQTVGSPNVSTTKLLRAPSGETTYTVAAAKTLKEMQAILLPWNTKFNKEIRILWSKTIKLEAQGNRASSKYITKYVPLNKRIQYNGDANNATCSHATYFVMWCARGDNDTSTGAIVEVSGYTKYAWHDV